MMDSGSFDRCSTLALSSVSALSEVREALDIFCDRRAPPLGRLSAEVKADERDDVWGGEREGKKVELLVGDLRLLDCCLRWAVFLSS